MLEIIPDPEFDDSDQWTITSSTLPLPANTAITGGQLISGHEITPPTLETGNCIVRPIDYLSSYYSLLIGATMVYSLTVSELYSSTTAEIKFGNITLWDKDDGTGTFTGSFVSDGNGGLQIKGVNSGFIVERVSVMADSIRESILQSLETQMKNMTTANGYDFNVATASVVRARRFFEESDLPAIGIFDGDETLAYDFNDTRARHAGHGSNCTPTPAAQTARRC